MSSPISTHTNHLPWNELIRVMSLQAELAREAPQSDLQHPGVSASIRQAANGCHLAQAKLLREIEAPCYRYCLAMLADPDLAHDATQETGLRVLQSLARYRGEAAPTTWALSIALNVCREVRRRQRRWRLLPANWIKHDPGPGPDAIAHQDEESNRLTQALSQLSPRQREAVTLRYLQGLSTKQTAEAMRCAEGTVKATLAKALSSLRQQWGQDDD